MGIQDDAERAAKSRFSLALRTARIARSRRYLIARTPIEAIAEASRKSRCAIVVMGAISRSGYKRLLIGNTAERILDELTCDIMVIKPETFRSDVPSTARGARLQVVAPMMLPHIDDDAHASAPSRAQLGDSCKKLRFESGRGQHSPHHRSSDPGSADVLTGKIEAGHRRLRA